MLPAIIGETHVTEALLHRLADVIAHQLEDPREAAHVAGITDAALVALMETEEFEAMLQRERAAWMHPDNSAMRVRLKADIALEDALPTIHRISIDPDLPVQSSLDAFKILKSLSSHDREREEIRSARRNDIQGQGFGDSGFSLTINLSGEQTTLNFDRPKELEDIQAASDHALVIEQEMADLAEGNGEGEKA